MTAVLAREQPQRLRSAILGGIGIGLIEGGGPGENVAMALEAPSLEDVTDPVGRTFRAFADQTRSDRRALAACLRGSRRLMTREEAAGIDVPVLIAVGTADEIAGSAQALGKIIPGSEVLDIPNRDHMRAVGDKVYKAGVMDFLSRRMTSRGTRPSPPKYLTAAISTTRMSLPRRCARHSGRGDRRLRHRRRRCPAGESDTVPASSVRSSSRPRRKPNACKQQRNQHHRVPARPGRERD